MTLSHVKTVDTTLDKELETHAHRIKVSWQDYKLKLVNVYAPPQGMYRSALFKKLGGLITRDCVSCGDWNCVPDVAKDVKSGSAEPYANIGGRLLNELMEERNLLDYHRHQLGDEFDFTRAGNTSSGVCRTRLDRWYVPTGDDWADLLWTIDVRSDLVVSDHRAVMLTVEAPGGEQGRDVKTINELIYKEPEILNEARKIVRDAYSRTRGSQSKKWMAAMRDLRGKSR